MKTWVLVASGAQARMFEDDGHGGRWREIRDLINPDERLHRQALQSDKPGRAFDKRGGQRHAVQTPVDPKEQVAIRFARELAEQLRADLYARLYQALWIVAPPHFLGLLREHLDNTVSRVVKGELTMDLTRASVDEIRDHLPQNRSAA